MASEEDCSSISSNNSSSSSDISSSDGSEVLVGDGEANSILPWRFEPVGRRREPLEEVHEIEDDGRHERFRNSNWYVRNCLLPFFPLP